MRDKILIYNDLEDLKKKCKACFKRDHDIFTCPQIHYVARKDFIIRRHLFSKPHLERAPFNRIDGKRVISNVFIREEDYRSSDEEFSEGDFIDSKDSSTEPQNANNSNIKKVSKIQSFKQINSLKIFGTKGSPIKPTPTATYEKETSWDQEFERIHVFTRYYTNNNADKVLKNYDNFMVKKATRIKKLKNMKKRKNMMASLMADLSPHKMRSSSFIIKSGKNSSRLKQEISEERSLQQSPIIRPDGTIFWNLENKKM